MPAACDRGYFVIARLRGRLVHKEPQEAVVDVSGVGYRVATPLSTFYRLGEVGDEVTLLIHTHVREDVLALFGFLTGAEQAVFERLIDVSGVGPRLALGILSGIEVPDLVEALGTGDVARLTRVPGVGKKTAERLVLELREKVRDLAAPVDAQMPPPAPSPKDDLLSALVHLGYSRPEAERVVGKALDRVPDARFEDVLRLSLRMLSGR
jgi:Holliday junction DNA helicase RuvA